MLAERLSAWVVGWFAGVGGCSWAAMVDPPLWHLAVVRQKICYSKGRREKDERGEFGFLLGK